MEGMTPYVDFSDSKGLLLWLIYGLGYLLSPDTYLGVFWLSVLAYTVTFFFIWRFARMFCCRREAVVVLISMSLLLFFRQLHDEVRAEDFCLPWICVGLFCCVRAMQSPTNNALRRYAFFLGMGMAWCLLIKWNLFFMMGGMALLVAGISYRQRNLSAIFFGLLGMTVAVLPFVVYLFVQGNFDDMVREYFVNTFLITDNGSGCEMWKSFLVNNVTHIPTTLKTLVLCNILAGMVMFCKRRNFSYWLVLAYLPFFVFLELKAPWRYYTETAVPFFVFLLVIVVPRCSGRLLRISGRQYALAMSLFYVGCIAVNVHVDRLSFFTDPRPARLTNVEQILKCHPYCKIMYAGHDVGWGLRARALPACKYWALQNGASQGMRDERALAIRERNPDFFLGNPISTDEERLLHSCGYQQCQVDSVENGIRQTKSLPLYVRASILR